MKAQRPPAPWVALARGGVVVGAGFVLLRFVLTPLRMQVLTRALPPAEYGTVTLLSMSAHGLALALSAGGFELLLRRLPGAAAAQRLAIFRSVLGVSTVAGLAACALALAGSGPLIGAAGGEGTVSRLAAAAFFLLFLHVLQRLYFLLGCREHLRARATQLLWGDAWFLALLPWGLGAGWTAEGAVWAWCGWMALVVAATWRWVPLGSVAAAPAGGAAVAGLLASGLPMLPAVLAEWTFRLAGQYVLLARADATTMALYALAFNVAGIGYAVGVPLIDALSTELNAVGGPPGASIRQLAARRSRIVARAVRLILAVSVPLGLAFVFFPRPIVALLAGPAFAPSAQLLPWAALVPLLLLANLLLARLLLAEGRSSWAGACSAAGALVAVVLSASLAAPHGARGVFVGITSGLALATGSMALAAPALLGADPREAGWGRVLAGGVLLAAVFALLARPAALPFVRLAAAAAVTLAVAVGFGWLRRGDFSAGAVDD